MRIQFAKLFLVLLSLLGAEYLKAKLPSTSSTVTVDDFVEGNSDNYLLIKLPPPPHF